jgi:hypothetical protein
MGGLGCAESIIYVHNYIAGHQQKLEIYSWAGGGILAGDKPQTMAKPVVGNREDTLPLVGWRRDWSPTMARSKRLYLGILPEKLKTQTHSPRSMLCRSVGAATWRAHGSRVLRVLPTRQENHRDTATADFAAQPLHGPAVSLVGNLRI